MKKQKIINSLLRVLILAFLTKAHIMHPSWPCERKLEVFNYTVYPA